MDVQHGRGLRACGGEHDVLRVVVAQDQVGDLVGHVEEQRVALFVGQLAVAYDLVEKDLDVDLVVGGVHTGGVVDEVGVDQAAAESELDARPLSQAEVAALADDLAAELGRVGPQHVVGLVADVGVGLAGRLDVGADAAVPQQVDGCAQDRVDQLVRGDRAHATGDAQRVAYLRRQRDLLGRTRVHTAALGDQRGVVVGPGAAGQREHPLTLAERRLGSGAGSRKMCRWSKAATSRMRVDSSMPLPKTSPDMSPTPTTVKSSLLHVRAERAEVVLHRLPGTAGGDAHALVVVADRAARGERVTEPEAVRCRDLVGDVGERRGALVGRDDQVGVVTVVAYDALGAGTTRPSTRLSVMSSRPLMNCLYEATPSERNASRSPGSGSRLHTNPPLAPAGTMTVFLTACALTRPRISVRKSSRRSDQRRPPRATDPNLRWTPSSRGE